MWKASKTIVLMRFLCERKVMLRSSKTPCTIQHSPEVTILMLPYQRLNFRQELEFKYFSLSFLILYQFSSLCMCVWRLWIAFSFFLDHPESGIADILSHKLYRTRNRSYITYTELSKIFHAYWDSDMTTISEVNDKQVFYSF